MEFVKHLKNAEELEEERHELIRAGLPAEHIPQFSNHIQFNNGLSLSVQASFGHYCSPRKTLPYDQYTSMEVALIHNDEFKQVKDYIKTDIFEEYYNGTVYGFVPVEKIEWLYDVLKNTYGLKGE